MKSTLFVLLIGLLGLSTPQVMAQSAASSDIRKKLQTQFIMAEEGDTIRIPAGNFYSDGSISMDEKKNVVIMGAGKDKTIISFKKQKEGAEGIRIANSKNIKIMHLTIQDAKGDLIKVMDTEGITFYDMKTEWTGKPKTKNGAYGFYPVSCSNVLIDKCDAIGASDAGIYVGQSHNIIVRNSVAYHNVAGIEIENSTMADVYNCEAYENTGGILVFDLPDLPKKRGGNVRVYDNHVHDNNYRNFAPKGNSVSFVPPGSGITILAASDVDVYNNKIINNQTASTSIASYHFTERPINDKEYYPYPTRIYIHDNVFERKPKKPILKNKVGVLFFAKFKKNVPHILFDGIFDPETLDENGQLKDEFKICVRNNGGAEFVNLDAEHGFKGLSKDPAPFDCERNELKAPELTANTIND